MAKAPELPKAGESKAKGDTFEYHITRGRMADYTGDMNLFQLTDELKQLIRTEKPELGACIDGGVPCKFHIKGGQEDMTAEEQVVTVSTEYPVTVKTVDGQLVFEKAE